MAGMRPLVVSAFFLVIGFLLVILGCTVVPNRNAWPLMSLMIYCFTPIPFFLCGGSGEGSSAFDDYSSVSTAFNTAGLFFGGGLLVSGPGLAIVLYHTGVISTAALWLTLSGGLCFAAMAAALKLGAGGGDDDDGEGMNFL